jgi:hypothetical protein
VEYVNAPYYDALTAPIIKDESTQLYEYVQITRDTEANASPLIFRNKDKGSWYLPSEGYLEIKLQLRNDGGAIGANEDLALINNALHLLEDARLRLPTLKLSTKIMLVKVIQCLRLFMILVITHLLFHLVNIGI